MGSGFYYTPDGGLPDQSELLTDRAVFTNSYAVIPRGCLTDIVASFLPRWTKTRLWVLARPMSGFSETFSHYIVEVSCGGGSADPDVDDRVEAVIFVTSGTAELTLDGGAPVNVSAGSYVYVGVNSNWALFNTGKDRICFHWIRKIYQHVEGLNPPSSFVTNAQEVLPDPMPDCDGRWSTTRFVSPDDLSHDMHVNIVNFRPGAVIPFLETHVMEHGIFILEGKAVYRLNSDWIEVEAGDYIWLRAFCPQACYAGGPGDFRYLLYKDVNRHAELGP